MGVEDYRYRDFERRLGKLEDAKPDVLAERVDELGRSMGRMETRLGDRIRSVDKALTTLDETTDSRLGKIMWFLLATLATFAASALTFALTIGLGLLR